MTPSPAQPGSAPPSWRWRILPVILTLVAIGVCAYLTQLHWEVHHEPSKTHSCAISEEVNCDTVALSRFSFLLGVPVSIWGLVFYGALLFFLVGGHWRMSAEWGRALLILAAAGTLGMTLYLFEVSEVLIQSFCPGCAGLYAINLGLAGCAVWAGFRIGIARRASIGCLSLGLAGGWGSFLLASQEPWLSLRWLGFGLMLAMGLTLGQMAGRERGWPAFVRVLARELVQLRKRPLFGLSLMAWLAGACLAVLGLVPPLYANSTPSEIAGGLQGLNSGQTPEGRPWIGATQPSVTVVEYSDYECPFCNLAHQDMRALVRENKSWLRLIHLHLPLDLSCNPSIGRPLHRHACDSARAAICAQQQGHFWEMNDRLFLRRGGLDRGGLAIVAEELGLDVGRFRACLLSSETEARLQEDLVESRMRNVRASTPVFQVGDQLIQGFKEKEFWVALLTKLRMQKGASAPLPRSSESPESGSSATPP